MNPVNTAMKFRGPQNTGIPLLN